MIYNEFIRLKPISVNDTKFILELINDPQVYKQAFRSSPTYDFEHLNWLNKRKVEDLDFIIIDIKTEQKMGRITIMNFDFQNQKCEYGISIASKFRNKKIAEQASNLIIDYVFNNMLINKIYLNVFSDNFPAIKLYNKLGFQIEGNFENEIYKNGSWKDVSRMAILKSNWKKK